ncbi:MAG: hypothetical protein Ta2G_08550 [Termitinemataceae bacterium]|nr:MAG: hypothetical protein Ta2G_08550 [Termitinemataceae bacterium]
MYHGIKNLVITCLITTCALFLCAQLVMFIAVFFFGVEELSLPINVQKDIQQNGFFVQIKIIFLSLFASLTEEFIFRYLLIAILRHIKVKLIIAIIISSALFALCHRWEGPAGVANAFTSGIILCAMFVWRGSFGGIVAAHFLFDLLAFEMALFAA